MCAYFDRAATGKIPISKLQGVLTHFNISLTPAEQEGVVQQFGAPPGSSPMTNQVFDSLYYEPFILSIFPSGGIVLSPAKTVATASQPPNGTYRWAGMGQESWAPTSTAVQDDAPKPQAVPETSAQEDADVATDAASEHGDDEQANETAELQDDSQLEAGVEESTVEKKLDPFHPDMFAIPEDVVVETTDTRHHLPVPAHLLQEAAAEGAELSSDWYAPDIAPEQDVLFFNVPASEKGEERAPPSYEQYSDDDLLRPPTAQSQFQELVRSENVYTPDVEQGIASRPATSRTTSQKSRPGTAQYIPRFDKKIPSRGNLMSRGSLTSGTSRDGLVSRGNTGGVWSQPDVKRPATGLPTIREIA